MQTNASVGGHTVHMNEGNGALYIRVGARTIYGDSVADLTKDYEEYRAENAKRAKRARESKGLSVKGGKPIAEWKGYQFYKDAYADEPWALRGRGASRKWLVTNIETGVKEQVTQPLLAWTAEERAHLAEMRAQRDVLARKHFEQRQIYGMLAWDHGQGGQVSGQMISLRDKDGDLQQYLFDVSSTPDSVRFFIPGEDISADSAAGLSKELKRRLHPLYGQYVRLIYVGSAEVLATVDEWSGRGEDYRGIPELQDVSCCLYDVWAVPASFDLEAYRAEGDEERRLSREIAESISDAREKFLAIAGSVLV